MRIFYVNVIEENAGWGAEYFANDAFRCLGHDTFCLDYRKYRNQLYRKFIDAPPSDVFLLQRGDQFPLTLIESIQTPRFFWASELVSRRRDQDRLLKSGLFDHIFLHTVQCMKTVISMGWSKSDNCSLLLAGFDQKIHRPIPNIQRDIDIIFVGTMTERRKKILHEVEKRFKVVMSSAFGEDLVLLFNRTKIVLNIHADNYMDVETRIFEALGCGAFLITERLPTEKPFSGDELVEFDSVDELCEKIQFYLNNEEERERIARRGYIAAISGHTYKHRAQQIVRTMQKYLHTRTDTNIPLKQSFRLRAYGCMEQAHRIIAFVHRHRLHSGLR